jgi:hypothetical protein
MNLNEDQPNKTTKILIELLVGHVDLVKEARDALGFEFEVEEDADGPKIDADLLAALRVLKDGT